MQQKTLYQRLEGHNLFLILENELSERNISEEFLSNSSNEDSLQRVLSALNALESALNSMESDSDAFNDEQEDEDDED